MVKTLKDSGISAAATTCLWSGNKHKSREAVYKQQVTWMQSILNRSNNSKITVLVPVVMYKGVCP